MNHGGEARDRYVALRRAGREHLDVLEIERAAFERCSHGLGRELLVQFGRAPVRIQRVVARRDAVRFQDALLQPARLAVDAAQHVFHAVVADRRARQVGASSRDVDGRVHGHTLAPHARSKKRMRRTAAGCGRSTTGTDGSAKNPRETRVRRARGAKGRLIIRVP